MSIILQLICFLTVFVARASASARPDNFLLTLDKDLHAIGAKRKCKDVGIIKSPEGLFDDYDNAEHDIFDFVEKAEKNVLTAAGHLVRHEMNALFSNHKRNRDKMLGLEDIQSGGRRGSHLHQKDEKRTSEVSTKKGNVDVAEQEDKHARINHLIAEYLEGDLE